MSLCVTTPSSRDKNSENNETLRRHRKGMKTYGYEAQAVWMRVHHLVKVSPPVGEINVTYPYFTEGKTELREVLHLPRLM